MYSNRLVNTVAQAQYNHIKELIMPRLDTCYVDRRLNAYPCSIHPRDSRNVLYEGSHIGHNEITCRKDLHQLISRIRTSGDRAV